MNFMSLLGGLSWAGQMYVQRRQLMLSMLLAVSAFFLALAGVIIGAVEVALQVQNGSTGWDAVMSVSLGLLALSAAAAHMARRLYRRVAFGLY